MDKNTTTKTWRQYEAGKDYKRKIGLYENVRRNERYYRGDQWHGSQGVNLPKPVFNVVRRIVDYLVCTVASGNISIRYNDENMPLLESQQIKDALTDAIEIMNKSANYRWRSNHMDRMVYKLLLDAALSGDGIIYCYWDKNEGGAGFYEGEIKCEAIDNSRLFLADVNRADIQSQDYVIISGRASVSSLKAEARACGADEEAILKITSDEPYYFESGDLERYELEGDDEKKATYLIKFWREDGEVKFEKSVKNAVIRAGSTGCKLYPVAYFNWCATKGSFHGTSAVTGLIPNQDFINRAYAMVMKHMTDTAFSKVIYDKTKIPEWSNEVGEAIAAVGGGNMADSVSVVGVGKLQDGYLELIENALSTTKELMGATDSALGSTEASNTSAILVLQEASRVSLVQIRESLCKFIEELADIWMDMMCGYYAGERPVLLGDSAKNVCFDLIRSRTLRASVDVLDGSKYSAASVLSLLDKLLDGGYVTAEEYLERIPDGFISQKEELINSIRAREEARDGRDA